MERKDYKNTMSRIFDGLMNGEGISNDDINLVNFGITLGWELISTYAGKKLLAEADITFDAWFSVFNLEAFSIDEELIERLRALVSSADKIIWRINANAYNATYNNVVDMLEKAREVAYATEENETAETSGAEEVTA